MKASLCLFALCALLALTHATVYFQEEFDDDWESRWVRSTADDAAGNAGKFVATPGQWYNDEAKDRGIQTSEDARYYKLSAGFPSFNNKDKDLVIQYSVKNEQKLDCGGGYVKLFPAGLDQASMNGDSQYNIMFGPDVCGAANKKVHFIFNYKDKNHLIKKTIKPADDQLTHLYTAIIHPDQTYEIRIDNEKKESGNLVEDWDFLPPKEIPDPEAKKPADWVDEAEIADPEAKKPEGWDDIPREIADADATKPEDWDDELDGEWEAPLIANPEYKGEWEPPMIPNPAYKGEWVHPMIPNPEYFSDDQIYVYDSAFVGFELWQVKTGTIFDHILITDSVEEAEAFANGYFAEQKAGEKTVFDKKEEERKEQEKAEREAERKKMEEEAKQREEEEATEGEAAGEEGSKSSDDDDDDDDDKKPASTNDKAHDEL